MTTLITFINLIRDIVRDARMLEQIEQQARSQVTR